jgi:hypothetical protein
MISAPNAHAVRSTIPVGCTCGGCNPHPRGACTNACRANIASSSGLIDTRVNHAHPGCAYTNAGCNPHARSADTGGRYWARNTSFGYANGLAINDGTRGHGGETKAKSQH